MPGGSKAMKLFTNNDGKVDKLAVLNVIVLVLMFAALVALVVKVAIT